MTDVDIDRSVVERTAVVLMGFEGLRARGALANGGADAVLAIKAGLGVLASMLWVHDFPLLAR